MDQLLSRPIDGIDTFSEEKLKEHGYYRGFVCAHNHEIRSIENHQCYHCVQKIFSNNCGFNINLLHADYKIKYMRLWRQVDIKEWSDCWEMLSAGSSGTRRVCLPSYRSFYTSQKSENFSFHKAIYQCAWGDVGKFSVTHACSNKRCANPLHLVSSWNRQNAPKSISPFVVDFKADELLMFNKKRLTDSIQELILKDIRPTISHPLDVLEIEEYNV